MTKKQTLSDKIQYENALGIGDVKEHLKSFLEKLKEELKTDLTGCFSSQKQCDEWNKDTNESIDKLAKEEFGELSQ